MGSNQSKVDDTSKQQQQEQQQPEKSNTPTRTTTDTSSNNESTASACPMKNADGSYSYDWKALFRSPHAPGGSKPIQKDDLTQQADGSLAPKQKQNTETSTGGGCPVKEYNVYSQPIDSTNNMPKVANQLPAPGQKKDLSTERVQSSISKVSFFE